MKYTIRHEDQITPAIEYAKRLLKETQKPVIITVSKEKRQRSLNQNSYYWAIVLKIIGDELGYFVEDVHKIFAIMFLKEIFEIGGHAIESYKSTTKLSTVQFEDYLQNIRQFASSELGIIIPLPNEVIDDDEQFNY